MNKKIDSTYLYYELYLKVMAPHFEFSTMTANSIHFKFR